jgi:hypothetical protein
MAGLTSDQPNDLMSSDTWYSGAPSPGCDGLDVKQHAPFDRAAFAVIV